MTAAPAAPATFEVIDPDADAVDAGVVGPWRVVEAPPEAVSFGAPGALEAARPVVWRVELAGPAGADATLAAEDARAERLDARLRGAAERVRAVLDAREAGAVSFAVGGLEAALPAAEAALLADLEGAVSFDVGGADEPPGGVGAYLEKLLHRATRLARVETRVAGRDVAATEVTLLGDVRTALEAGATAEEAGLASGRSQRRSARARAWARIVLQTLRVALLLSTGNVVLAMPAAWRFIRSVMDEAKALEGSEVRA